MGNIQPLSSYILQDNTDVASFQTYLEMLDEYQGRWQENTPYRLTYSQNTLIREYDPTKVGGIIRMNGKLWNGKNYIPVHIPYKNVSEYSTDWINMFYLICGKVKDGKSMESAAKALEVCSRNPCTDIGDRISNSLIKVASTKIFEDPRQSIVEMITNSVDSYNTINNRPKIGRFGMGFFSILYFIVGKSGRTFHIISTKDGITSHVSIKDDKGLKFKVHHFKSYAYLSGTTIRIGCDIKSKFSDEDIQSFTKFIEYTRDISTVSILSTLQEKCPIKDSIMYTLNKSYLEITDYAQGMSIETILNHLLIPSISSKLPIPGMSYTNYSNIRPAVIPLNGKKKFYGEFKILVNEVCIISVFNDTKYDVLLSLPGDIPLPVARNDIILKRVYPEFLKSVIFLVTKSQHIKDLRPLENSLINYANLTSNSDNKLLIPQVFKNIYSTTGELPRISAKNVGVYNLFHIPYCISNDVSVVVNDAYMHKIKMPGYPGIFINKTVVFLELDIQPTDADTYSYLFLPNTIHSQPGWTSALTMTYTNEYLVERESKESEEKEKVPDYADFIKGMLVHSISLNKMTVKNLSDITDSVRNILNAAPIARTAEYFSKYAKMLKSIAPYDIYSSTGRECYPVNTSALYTVSIGAIPSIQPFNEAQLILIDSLFEHCTRVNCTKSPECFISILSDNLLGIQEFANITKVFPEIREIRGFVLLCVLQKYKYIGEFAEVNKVHISYVCEKYLSHISLSDLVSYNFWNTDINCINCISAFEMLYTHTTDTTDNEFSLPDVPRVSFTIKQLINHSFSNDVIEFKAIDDSPVDLDLKILEIAVNSGTTKPFIDATLTELFQNSVDAIRRKPENIKDIVITSTIKGSMIYVNFQDFIGMSKSSFISMLIPFYSRKTASPLTTGEMGTGFFNIYRGSKTVKIDTCLYGERHLIIQHPVKDENGVVDIECTVLNFLPQGTSNGTSITFTIPFSSDEERVYIETSLSRCVHSSLSMCPDVNVEWNGQSISKTKDLMYSTPEFEAYYVGNLDVSQIASNNIPFATFESFIKTFSASNSKGLYNMRIYKYCYNGLYINLKHGSYSGVQSRTNVRFSQLTRSRFVTFLKHAVMTVIFAKIADYLHSSTTLTSRDSLLPHQLALIEEFLPNFYFNGDISQVLPQQLSEEVSLNYTPSVALSNYRTLIFSESVPNADSRHNGRVAHLLYHYSENWKHLLLDNRNPMNMHICLVLAEWIKSKVSVTFMLRYLNVSSNIHKLLVNHPNLYDQQDMLKISRTLSIVKQKILDADIRETNMVELEPIDYRNMESLEKVAIDNINLIVIENMDTYDKIFVQMVQDFVDTYCEIANSITPGMYHKINVDIDHTLNFRALAYYTHTTATISVYPPSKRRDTKTGETTADHVNLFASDIRKYKYKQGLLRDNSLYMEYFGFTQPCSIIVHELEHARNGNSHNDVVHDDAAISVFGVQYPMQTYSECANTSYKVVLANGLVTKWLNKVYKFIKSLKPYKPFEI